MKKQGTRDQGTKRIRTELSLLRPGNLIGTGMILLAAAAAVAPELVRGNSCGHDFDVHLVSWIDCLNSWRHGIPYPHWAPSPNYGAGEPRFVFYPPLTWMLGAALGAIFPWHFAPIALTFLTLAGAGLATRALALEALDDAPATLAGCAAIFSGFSLFTAYERCSFPEFAGSFWLPLIVLFALRGGRQQVSGITIPPISQDARNGWGTARSQQVGKSAGQDSFAPFRKRRRRMGQLLFQRAFDGSAAPLAVVFAGAWLSNLPLAVMATYLLAGVALLAAAINKSWAPLLRAAAGGALGLGLAAVYWLPAAMERHWVDIRVSTTDPGYNFENSWLFARHANPLLADHDVVLRQASWIAVSMVAVAVVCLLIAWRRDALPAQKPSSSGRWWIVLAAIPVVTLFFMCSISRPLWHALPEMPFLQYPWRWLEAVEAPMGILFAAAVWPRTLRGRRVAVYACAAAFLAAIAYADVEFFQVCDDEDAVASMVTTYRAGAGFEGMAEYEPPGGDDTMIATGLPDACLVGDPTIVLGKPVADDPDANPAWTPTQGSCMATLAFSNGSRGNPEHRAMDAEIPEPGYLVLRLLSYPAWTIRANGQTQTRLTQRDDGLILLPVAQGPLHLAVDWTTTRDVVGARWLSAMSLLLLVALWIFELRRASGRLT
jgi:hypothetical protein